MTKKIAIATFHAAHNYGAVLQTYALYKTLQKIGLDVYLLDYSPQSLIKSYTLFPRIADHKNFLGYAKGWMSLLLDFKRRYNRYTRFNSFLEKNFKVLPGSEKNIDFIVVGSDQIWNPTITNGMDPNYFGDCKTVTAQNVFSYAASMGVSSLSDEDEKRFIALLSNLSYVGVREETLKNYINTLTNKDVFINLDPTLLLDKHEWLLHKKNDKNAKYLLIYEVKEHSQTSAVANEIASRLGLEIIVLSAKTNYKISKGYKTDKSPEEFLELFQHASFIVTTSFHGTVFSIINGKNFLTLEFGNDIDLRAKYLLSKVGLENRLIKDMSLLDSKSLTVDYAGVHEKLDFLREQSKEYLKNAIQD